MLTVLIQPNLVCGDIKGNARTLARLAAQVLSQHELEAGDTPFLLTPGCALAGMPWEGLAQVGGFYRRCREGAKYLASLLPTIDPRLGDGPDMLISLPAPQGQDFYLLSKGRAEQLNFTRDGLLMLPCWNIYVPFAGCTQGSPHAAKEALSSRPGLASAIVCLEPRPFVHNRDEEEEAARLARQMELPAFVLNPCGATDGVVYGGQSRVYDTGGKLAARALAFKEDALALRLHTNGEGLLFSGRIEKDLKAEEALFQAAVTGVRDYARKCGITGAVLGLSGGMDSALVACIAVEALGAENVMALLMPSPWSSNHSVTDAQTLANNLNIASHTIPINDMLESFSLGLNPVFAALPPEDTLWEENIQARIRGVILMAFANRLGRIVLGTGNKSEGAVGYCTLYGDTVGSLEPIGDIYKTRVYDVARWYNEARQNVIPDHIFTKAPSAELRPGQKDQDSLPPYEVLDPILEQLFEGGKDPDHIASAQADRAEVERVLGMVAHAEFKRHQSPPVIAMTTCALGQDWHMPAAARPFPPLDED